MTFGRIGIEAGPLSQWLVNALTAAELPVICVETRHMKALLTAQQINKTDRNDARGIAQMMRVGLFKPVHVKTLVAQEQRMLLTSRKLLQRKLLDLESDLRGTLRSFGLKVGVVSGGRYEARVRELVAGFPRLAAIAEPLLSVRRVMRQQLAVLHKMLLDTVRHAPCLQRRPSGDAGQQTMCGDEQRFPRDPVAALADRAVAVDLARGIFAQCQSEMSADVAGSSKARRIVDRRRKGQRRHRARSHVIMLISLHH